MDILPGQLAFLVVVAAFDAALLGWLTLRWYQRAVTRLMGQPSSREERAAWSEDVPAVAPITGGPMTGTLPADGVRHGHAGDAWLRRRLVPAYLVGALLFSTVIGAGMTVATGTVNVAIVAAWLWIFAWPVVPSLGVLLACDRRQTLVVALAYLASGAVAVAAVTLVSQALRGAIDDAPLTNIHAAMRTLFAAGYAGAVLVALTAWRPVRLVMPLALATSLTFGLALLITPRLVAPAFEVAVIRDAVLSAPMMGSGVPLYYATVLLVALPLGWIAWRVLDALAAAHAGKRFSDVQLVVDCWWVIVAAEASVTHLVTPFGAGGLAVGAVAFVAYRAGVAIVLRLTGIGSRAGAGRLLLLRVFGHQARTEALFDAIGQRWRLRGPVHLIGAADLARRTTDPGDVLTFVDGRLAEQFVASRADIPRRLGQLDMAADPDGRFRVNEVYCHDGVWRETLVALLRLTDVVVMDLRRFGRDNRGCIFEIEQLCARLPPERIVLICDADTDRQLLREVLAGAPERLAPAAVAPETAIVSVQRNSRRELAMVMARLVRATAGPVRV
jgi:hypothetical protein